ncbi:MAG: type I pantothenate kinase [Candidatus Liberibacter europaeus]|uniref:Pantothenate kinase n=1 Tax=Candidatus Liberibacter europaeus TaxID=744859 RepID=A0A2T4VZA2_9HYPH|nr:type I pantothenate kinase [Candidatus Liberibacter europaeus]PTL87088.1 MAG: type I pantothenate kinase [Candidatus Liberibacter europaeus]
MSHYHVIKSSEWANCNFDLPPNLKKDKIDRLFSFKESVNLNEICRIYSPLAQLLFVNMEHNKILFQKQNKFLNIKEITNPTFVIGITGSVAVGKSTMASILCKLLQLFPSTPKVNIITTDVFLFPNNILIIKNLMNRKGFPESYDSNKLLTFLYDIKSGKKEVFAPRYSHSQYNIIEGEVDKVIQSDILIIEGINVLQQCYSSKNERVISMISDFIDFSIYVDADENMVQKWYISRFMKLRDNAFDDPSSYFHRFTQMSKHQAKKLAEKTWEDINLQNLKQNILPTRNRANLILKKGDNHSVENIKLRKL